MSLPKANTQMRTTWANLNKGLACIILAIPIGLGLYGIWSEFPQDCQIYGNGEYDLCDNGSWWKNPTVAENWWNITRVEISLMVIFGISLLCYVWAYNDGMEF